MIMKNAENPLIQTPCRTKFVYTEYPDSVLHCDSLVSRDKYTALCVSSSKSAWALHVFNAACLFFMLSEGKRGGDNQCA